MTAPAAYLAVNVPDDIAAAWTRWEAATWRRMRWLGDNRRWPPDERFNVRLPAGMCVTHRQMWLDYRNMHFNPETGNRWPGEDGSPFQYHGADMAALREERRVEWDEKAGEQMRLIERICLSGWSPQCDGNRIGTQDGGTR